MLKQFNLIEVLEKVRVCRKHCVVTLALVSKAHFLRHFVQYSSDSDQRKLILMVREVYGFVSLEIQTFVTKEVQFCNDNRDISTGVRLDPTW